MMEPVKKLRNKVILYVLLSLFLLLWIFPVYSDGISDVMAKSGYLDGSWKVGLNWATVMGLKFGKDIVFQYGPFYFLSDNSLLNINRMLYFGANIFSVVLFLISMFLFLKFIIEKLDFSKLKDRIFSYTIIILAAYVFLNIYIEIPEILLLLAFLLIFRLIEKDYSWKKNLLYAIFIGFIFSVLSLVKFYYLIASIALIVISIVFFIVSKKSHIFISLLGSFIVFFILIWLIFEKSLYFLFLYVKNGFALTSGYSESLQLFFEDWQGQFFWEGKFIILYALLLFALWVFFIIYGIIKKDNKTVFYFILSFPVLFLVFKQGFTRMDHFHTQEYFRFIVFLLIFTLLFFGQKAWKMFPVLLIFIILAIPFRTVDEPLNVRRRISYNLSELSKVTKIIKTSAYDTNQIRGKEEIRNLFVRYKDVINHIDKNDTVDIFPFEVIVPYVYDLKWHPRPLIQSVTVYNEKLNELDAEHFSGEDAPQKVIYRIDSIDGRYYLFDEPLVFQEFLKGYNFIYTNNEGIGLLEKQDKEIYLDRETIEKTSIHFNELVKIPEVNNGYLFCKINIEPNIFGEIKNLLYKGNYVYMKFHFVNSEIEPVTVRFLRENARLGFFIQNYVDNINLLEEVFLQKSDKYYDIKESKIEAIEILTNNSNVFEDNISIEFYILKFD